MDIYPPIHERTDEQIKEIMQHPKHYRKEVVELAEREFYKRGFSKEELVALLKRGQSKERHKRWVEKKFKTNESHFDWGLLWSDRQRRHILFFILAWPFTLILMIDYKRDGRHKKFDESAVFVIIGMVLWTVILILLRR